MNATPVLSAAEGFVVAISLLLALIAAAFLFMYWALIYRPHPRIVGRLRLPGLASPAEVLRDRWGVPHIYAESEQDLWFVHGFVHAQDRLWQMEQYRRVAAGRMSEGVGEEGLRIDRLARIIGFRRAAERQVEALSAETRALLERYAEGVNAFLSMYRHRLPMEFTLLGLKPEPWTPADSLCIILLLGWGLTTNWQEELARVGLFTRLGPERAAELMPDTPDNNPCILPGDPQGDLSRLLLDAYHELKEYLGLTAPGQGSNNWVVNGQRSITGHPLLANDPHLAVTMPGIWHLAHLETRDGEIRLIGAGSPGIPGVTFGHNGHVAWGGTAGFADTADLYVEKRHPRDSALFQFGDDWEEAEVRAEAIKVRGREQPELQRVTITRHGPLITDLMAEHESNYPPLALRWTGFEPESSIEALVGMLRARDWDSFRRAAGRSNTPVLSLVYADRQDNIGYLATGKVPLRAAGYGLMPAPGHSGSHEWIGFVPADEMPQLYNPDGGQVTSSNNRVTPAGFHCWWGIDVYPGYRARRIMDLLNSRPKLSTRDFRTMQLDTFNYLGQMIAPFFTLIDPKDPWERRAQRALLEWNYRMDVDSAAALAFELVLVHLMDLVFSDKLGPLASDYKGQPRVREFGGGAFHYQAAVKLAELLQQEESWWFGEGMTGKQRSREELLSLALKRAVETMKQEVSDDARRWHWGRLHQIYWQHPLGVVRPLRRLLNRGPFPVAGSAQTINAQHLEHELPFRTVTVAPTLRMIIDVGNWDRSTFVACPGQSGLPAHRFYANLMHVWLEGDMIPMSFSRQKVEESDPLYRLELAPL